MPHKVVIDTNVWVSYFINARAEYLIGWIIDHPVEIYTSSELADEIEEVLARPKFKKATPFPATLAVIAKKQTFKKQTLREKRFPI
jgi:putative PIN family toxin of toxin-antitoxin system